MHYSRCCESCRYISSAWHLLFLPASRKAVEADVSATQAAPRLLGDVPRRKLDWRTFWCVRTRVGDTPCARTPLRLRLLVFVDHVNRQRRGTAGVSVTGTAAHHGSSKVPTLSHMVFVLGEWRAAHACGMHVIGKGRQALQRSGTIFLAWPCCSSWLRRNDMHAFSPCIFSMRISDRSAA